MITTPIIPSKCYQTMPIFMVLTESPLVVEMIYCAFGTRINWREKNQVKDVKSDKDQY